MTKWDDRYSGHFYGLWATVGTGPICKEFEKNAPYRKILSVEHVRCNSNCSWYFIKYKRIWENKQTDWWARERGSPTPKSILGITQTIIKDYQFTKFNQNILICTLSMADLSGVCIRSSKMFYKYSPLIWYNMHHDLLQKKLFWLHLGDVVYKSLIYFVWFDSSRPINNLSVIKGRVFLGWTSTKLGLMCLAQRHNTVMPVRLEPAVPRSWVKHSTTETQRSWGMYKRAEYLLELCSLLHSRLVPHAIMTTYRKEKKWPFDPPGVNDVRAKHMLACMYASFFLTWYATWPYSEKSSFYISLCDSRNRSYFGPRGVIWTNLEVVH